MASIQDECPNCGAAIRVFVGQAIVSGGLVWSQGHRCDACGDSIEADGHGQPPAAIVAALLAEEGEWELWVRPVDSEIVRVLRVLREALCLSLPDAARLKGNIPGPVTSGTKKQIDCLAKLLQQEGIDAKAQPRTKVP